MEKEARKRQFLLLARAEVLTGRNSQDSVVLLGWLAENGAERGTALLDRGAPGRRDQQRGTATSSAATGRRSSIEKERFRV